MMKRSMLAVAVLISAATAQTPILRGQKYVLRVPLEALTLDSVSTWSGSPVYVGTIEIVGTEASVNGSSTWFGKDFPNDKTLVVKKIRTDRRTGQYEVELGGELVGDPVVKLRFASETVAAAAVPIVLISSNRQDEVASWRDAVFAKLAETTFVGPLSQIPKDRQRQLLDALRAEGTGKVKVDTYKEKTYLTVDFGAGKYVYNTLQMNQTERVARRVAEVLGTVKSLYRAVGTCPDSIYGIESNFSTSFKNFVSDYDQGRDSVQAYFPCELIAKFQDADISSQTLVNGSVVIVNGDRVEVSLTQ